MTDKQIIANLTAKLEAATKPKWVNIHNEKPAYGEPVLISINSVVQKITYNLDGSDDRLDWLEPHSTIGAYDDMQELTFFVTHDLNLEWQPLPPAPEVR